MKKDLKRKLYGMDLYFCIVKGHERNAGNFETVIMGPESDTTYLEIEFSSGSKITGVSGSLIYFSDER